MAQSLVNRPQTSRFGVGPTNLLSVSVEGSESVYRWKVNPLLAMQSPCWGLEETASCALADPEIEASKLQCIVGDRGTRLHLEPCGLGAIMWAGSARKDMPLTFDTEMY